MSQNSGRDTIIKGNNFINCDKALHIDDRGMTGEKPDCLVSFAFETRNYVSKMWNLVPKTHKEFCIEMTGTKRVPTTLITRDVPERLLAMKGRGHGRPKSSHGGSGVGEIRPL